jgi:hypothetical protein
MPRRIKFTKMYRPMAFGQTDITGTVYEAQLKASIRARRRREDAQFQERAIREEEEYPETIWERVAGWVRSRAKSQL